MSTISFPNMFDYNNHTSSTNLSYNYKSIHESLTNLLMTTPGELLGDPLYGCNIKQLIFDIKNNANINIAKSTIINAIHKYVPYVNVNTSDIKIYNNSNNNRYKLVITYSTMTNSNLQVYELIV